MKNIIKIIINKTASFLMAGKNAKNQLQVIPVHITNNAYKPKAFRT